MANMMRSSMAVLPAKTRPTIAAGALLHDAVLTHINGAQLIRVGFAGVICHPARMFSR